jgi:chaperonin GroES
VNIEEMKEISSLKVKRLINDRVLVKRKPHAEMTESGLHIPDGFRERVQDGIVIAIGPGKMSTKGERIPMEVKVGDKVLVSIRAIREIKVNGEMYLDMRDKDIFGVIE